MRTTLYFGAALTAAVLLLTPTGHADSTPASTPTPARSDDAKADSPTKNTSRSVPFRGKVAAVDAQQMTFTLSGPKQRVFRLTTDSKVEKDGKPAAFADIALGDEARGLYQNGDDGKLVVVKASFGPKPENPANEAKNKTAKSEPGS